MLKKKAYVQNLIVESNNQGRASKVEKTGHQTDITMEFFSKQTKHDQGPYQLLSDLQQP